MKRTILTLALVALAVGGLTQSKMPGIHPLLESQPLNLQAVQEALGDIVIAHTNFIGTNYFCNEQPTNMLNCARQAGTLSNLVKLLCEQGEVCKVYGHAWESFEPKMFYYASRNFRKCCLCNLKQCQNLEWK